MATPTSLLLMASGDQTAAQEKSSVRTLFRFEEMKPEANTNSATEGSDCVGPIPKKRQRGLGVAQLERLRLQERWKTMRLTTDVAPFQHESLPRGPVPLPLCFGNQNQMGQHHGHPHPTGYFTETNSLRRVPMQYGTSSYSHALSQMGTNGSTMGLFGLRTGGGCSTLINGEGGGGSCHGFGGTRMLVSNRVNMVESRGVGVLKGSKFLTGNAFQTSNELSSMPKICPSDRRNVWFKKTHPNASDPKRSNRKASVISLEMSSARNRNSDFMSYNPYTGPYFNAEPSNFSGTAMRSAAASFSSTNLDQNIDVVGRRAFMVYEFFPDKIGRDTSEKEGELLIEGSVAVGCEASSVSTTSAYGDASTNSIDLSLKLSV